MSDTFECPKCEYQHSVSEKELWAVYDCDGKETDFTCDKCQADLVVCSEVRAWHFEAIEIYK